jgi:hypothetical protein
VLLLDVCTLVTDNGVPYILTHVSRTKCVDHGMAEAVEAQRLPLAQILAENLTEQSIESLALQIGFVARRTLPDVGPKDAASRLSALRDLGEKANLDQFLMDRR